MLAKREAEVATVLKRNPRWWGRFEGNVDEVVYRPIKSDATRMAALLTGELDLVLDPPLQDVPRLRSNPAIRIVEGSENRVIFLVMDQNRDELKYSSVKGKNPLKDLPRATGLLHGDRHRGDPPPGDARPGAAHGRDDSLGVAAPSRILEPRLFPFDVARAKKLLAEAGYPDGFELGLLCPNNRYVNDERICTAIAGMLAKIGVRVNLTAIPRAQFFQRVDQFDVSMHLYGWGGATTDPGFTLTPVDPQPRRQRARANSTPGATATEALDGLIDSAEREMDPARTARAPAPGFPARAGQRLHDPAPPPSHPWAVRSGVQALHRADNVLEATWVRID